MNVFRGFIERFTGIELSGVGDGVVVDQLVEVANAAVEQGDQGTELVFVEIADYVAERIERGRVRIFIPYSKILPTILLLKERGLQIIETCGDDQVQNSRDCFLENIHNLAEDEIVKPFSR